jgi:hypothetical protein
VGQEPERLSVETSGLGASKVRANHLTLKGITLTYPKHKRFAQLKWLRGVSKASDLKEGENATALAFARTRWPPSTVVTVDPVPPAVALVPPRVAKGSSSSSSAEAPAAPLATAPASKKRVVGVPAPTSTTDPAVAASATKRVKK